MDRLCNLQNGFVSAATLFGMAKVHWKRADVHVSFRVASLYGSSAGYLGDADQTAMISHRCDLITSRDLSDDHRKLASTPIRTLRHDTIEESPKRYPDSLQRNAMR